MKSRLALATALFGTLVASPAFAQDGTTPPPAAAPAAEVEASAQPEKKLSLGAQLELLPAGNMDVTVTGPGLNLSDSSDTATAYGVSATLGYDLTPNISIGAAPRLLLNVKAESATGSAKEIDLRARVAVHGEVAPTVQIYGFVAPGYAWVVPSKGDVNFSGGAIGFGAGAAFDVSSELFVNAELGYQLAFLSADSGGQHADIDESLFHLGVGAGTRF